MVMAPLQIGAIGGNAPLRRRRDSPSAFPASVIFPILRQKPLRGRARTAGPGRRISKTASRKRALRQAGSGILRIVPDSRAYAISKTGGQPSAGNRIIRPCPIAAGTGGQSRPLSICRQAETTHTSPAGAADRPDTVFPLTPVPRDSCGNRGGWGEGQPAPHIIRRQPWATVCYVSPQRAAMEKTRIPSGRPEPPRAAPGRLAPLRSAEAGGPTELFLCLRKNQRPAGPRVSA